MKMVLLLIVGIFSISLTSCISLGHNNDVNLSNRQDGEIISIDNAEVRQFSDEIADFIKGELYSELLNSMENDLRNSMSVDQLKKSVEEISKDSGRLTRAEFKKANEGVEFRLSGKRKSQRFWYSIKTTKKEMGEYFLIIDIVIEDKRPACSKFSIVKFSNGVPPDLR